MKKSKFGRKPVPDKKAQVALYVLISQMKKFGGIDEFNKALYDFVSLHSLNEA